MLVRRSLTEALGFAFDPRYFIWFEDVDLCREAWARDWSVVHLPSATAIDLVGQSFAKQASVWKQRRFSKSMLIYFKKWESFFAYSVIAVLRPISIALVWVYSFSKK
jgi:GT2 family glycosyltransferase